MPSKMLFFLLIVVFVCLFVCFLFLFLFLLFRFSLGSFRVEEILRVLCSVLNIELVEAQNFTATYLGQHVQSQQLIAVKVKVNKRNMKQ